MVSAGGPNRRRPSSNPRRGEHAQINSSGIMDSLLLINDGRGEGPVGLYGVLAVLQPKLEGADGVSHKTVFTGDY